MKPGSNNNIYIYIFFNCKSDTLLKVGKIKKKKPQGPGGGFFGVFLVFLLFCFGGGGWNFHPPLVTLLLGRGSDLTIR